MSMLLGLRQLLGDVDATVPEPDPVPESERATDEIDALPRRPVD